MIPDLKVSTQIWTSQVHSPLLYFSASFVGYSYDPRFYITAMFGAEKSFWQNTPPNRWHLPDRPKGCPFHRVRVENIRHLTPLAGDFIANSEMFMTNDINSRPQIRNRTTWWIASWLIYDIHWYTILYDRHVHLFCHVEFHLWPITTFSTESSKGLPGDQLAV